VDSVDVGQTQAFSAQITDGTNFRCDVNQSGSINGGDTLMVRAASGTSAPGPAPARMDISYRRDAAGRETQLLVPGVDHNFAAYEWMGRLNTITQVSDPLAVYHYFHGSLFQT